MMRVVAWIGLLAVVAVLASKVPNYQGCNNLIARAHQYCNASLSHEERVESLISGLSVEERIMLISPDARLGSTCNMHTAGILRLGLPQYMWLVEVNTAVAAACFAEHQCATNFIGPEGLGASFNRSLWYAKGDVISTEQRAFSNADWARGTGRRDFIGLAGFGPNINIVRDPRFGRNSELPGEDPFLSGVYAAEYVKGMQQVDDKGFVKMLAYLKHFDAYSVEVNRGHDSYNISQYDFADTYLPQYKLAFAEGGASGVMCSYNAENGVPSCANGWLLNDVMRKQWNQPSSVVMSDCGAISNLLGLPVNAPSPAHAAAWSINNGTDLEAGSTIWTEHMHEAYKQGLVTEETITNAVRRTQLQLMRTGRYDAPESVSWTQIPTSVINSSAHQQLNLESSLQSFVLLKHENKILPLTAGKTIAVIGPQGVAKAGLLSDYSGDQVCWKGGDECIISLADAITDLNVGGQTLVQKGVDINSNDTSGINAALVAATIADIVILALGIDKPIEHEAIDRTSITLPGLQTDFANQIFALNKPTILILTNGGALAIESLLPHPSAIIEAFNPATVGMRGLGETMFGLHNRWGKMPYTIYPAEYLEQVEMTNFDMSLAPGRTYRYYTGNATFPFGFGLSLTTFDLGCYSLSNALEFACNVSNTGDFDGDEVVLVYHSAGEDVRKTVGSAHPIPIRRLVAFDRISVQKGDKGVVKFQLANDDLALTTASGDRVVYPGTHLLTFSRGHGQDETVMLTVPALY